MLIIPQVDLRDLVPLRVFEEKVKHRKQFLK